MLVGIKKLFSKKKQESQCIFCNIIKDKKEDLLYEDDQFYSIHDIKKASAVQHVLIITKNHIETALGIQSPATILKMKEIGVEVLKKLCQKNGVANPTFRFGFHLPPYNSIDHVHLHCFVEPLSAFISNSIIYGWCLDSIQSVIEKIQVKIKQK